MKTFVGQFYTEAGVNYPFSHHFQRFISRALTERILTSELFIDRYADDFELMFNMNAKSTIATPEICGPTVFKVDKDVEYTIFLPYDNTAEKGVALYTKVLNQLIDQIVIVLENLDVNTTQIETDRCSIIDHIAHNPIMFAKRWDED